MNTGRYFFSVFVLAFVFAAVAAQTASSQGSSSYHQVHEYKLSGDTGWDYLTMDASTRRLYISRGTHVQVLNIDSGKLEGDIPDTPGVHGIALAKDLGKGFVSNGRDSSVTVFDLDSLKATGKVPAGTNPDAILFDPFSKRVFAFNGRSHDVTVIDAKDAKATGTIPLDGKPEFAVSDGKGKVFVNIEDKSELVQIDAKALKVANTWPLAPCESPSGLAIDVAHERLFAGCDNKLMAIVNGDTGKVIATAPIGEEVDATAFDEDQKQAYSSNGEGNITVVKEDSPDKFHVLESVSTKPRARTMTVDEKTHNLITVTAEFEKPAEAKPGEPRPRPKMVPDSFVVLVYGK